MNCQEFAGNLSESNVTPAMQAHAEHCPACRELLRLQGDIDTSLHILGQATPKVDLTAGIMGQVRSLAQPAPQPADTFVDKMVRLFDASLLKPALALTMVGLLAVGIYTHTSPSPATKQGQWRVAAVGEELRPATDATVTADATPVRLASLRGVDAHLQNGRVEFQHGDLYLHSGTLSVKVAKQDPKTPFSVNTPHGRVEVVGTAFEVKINENTISINVTEGIVAYHGQHKTRRLYAGERFVNRIVPTDPVPSTTHRPDYGQATAGQEVETPGE